MNRAAQRLKLAKEPVHRHFGLDHIARTACRDQILWIESISLPEPLPSDPMIDFEAQGAWRLPFTVFSIDAPRGAMTVLALIPCRV